MCHKHMSIVHLLLMDPRLQTHKLWSFVRLWPSGPVNIKAHMRKRSLLPVSLNGALKICFWSAPALSILLPFRLRFRGKMGGIHWENTPRHTSKGKACDLCLIMQRTGFCQDWLTYSFVLVLFLSPVHYIIHQQANGACCIFRLERPFCNEPS